MPLSTFQYEQPISEFKGTLELCELAIAAFKDYLKKEDLWLPHPIPDGDDFLIRVIHPLGSDWGMEKAKVEIDYFAFVKNG